MSGKSAARLRYSRRAVAERTLLLWFVVALLFVLLLTGAVLLNRATWSRRAERKLVELEEAGYAITMATLRERYLKPDSVPPENAAVFYERAFAAVDTQGGFDEAHLPYYGNADLPEPGEPLAQEVVLEIERFLARNAEAIGYFLEASKFEHCAFPFSDNIHEMLIREHVGPMRDGARLLSLQTIHALHDGRPDEAAEATAAIFRMANHLSREPFLIGALTRVALLGIGHFQLERILHSPGLSEEILVVLQQALAGAHDEEMLAGALEGELLFGLASFEDMSDWFDPASNPIEYFESGRWKFDAYLLLGQMNRDLYHYMHRMEEAIERARGPVHLRVLNEDSSFGNWELEDPTWSEFIQGRWMSERFGVTTDVVFKSERVALARIRAGLVGVAANRYFLRNGHYPDELSQLAGEYLDPAQAIDPFTNQALDYRTDADGVVITVDDDVLLRLRASRPIAPDVDNQRAGKR